MLTYRQWKDQTVRSIAADHDVPLTEAESVPRNWTQEYLDYAAGRFDEITPTIVRSILSLVGSYSEFTRWARHERTFEGDALLDVIPEQTRRYIHRKISEEVSTVS